MILKVIWYYIECCWTKIQRLFGYRKDTSVIPKGEYCYILDEERNKTHTCKDGGYWIKPCPYFRNFYKQGYSACTYTGFIGWSMCHWDQCKICGINYDEYEYQDK